MLSLLHAGAQGGAAGFQCIQRGLCLGPLRVGQGCTSGSGLRSSASALAFCAAAVLSASAAVCSSAGRWRLFA